MRKRFYSLVLIAAGLLIGTQCWAEVSAGDADATNGVASISGNYYSSLQKAVDAIPTEGGPYTIVLQKDIDIPATANWQGENGDKACLMLTKKDQNIVLDLAGKHIDVVCCKKAAARVIWNVVGATLTIRDSQYNFDSYQPMDDNQRGINKDTETGRITFKDNNVGQDGSVIENKGTLIFKSGCLRMLTDHNHADTHGSGATYCIDNGGNETTGSAFCTIENGFFYSNMECIRNYSTTNKEGITSVLTIQGGYFYGIKGLVFSMDGGTGQTQSVIISGGKFYSENYPLVRIYTADKGNLGAHTVRINGEDVYANVDALCIQHTGGGLSDQEMNDLAASMFEQYPSVFEITAGTFKSENFDIRVNNVFRDENGAWHNSEGEMVLFPCILPTLLNGDLYYDKSTNNEDCPSEIKISLLEHGTISSGSWTDDPSNYEKAITIDGNVTVESGVKDSCYHVTVANGGVLTVKEGAIVTTGKGGVTVEQGGRINVEAGGILIVGAFGCETAQTNSIYVYSDLDNSGVVLFDPAALLRQHPEIVVKWKSNACLEEGSDQFWQLIAIPTTDNPQFTNHAVTSTYALYDPANQGWVSLNYSQVNTPFRGYMMTNNGATRGSEYTMAGYMNSKDDATVTLSNQGWNAFGNSYMAPIDLKKFFNACFGDEEKGNVNRNILVFDSKFNNYEAITQYEVKSSTGYVKKLAPMQGFFMYSESVDPVSFTFKYKDCVWGYQSTEPILTPSRTKSNGLSTLQVVIEAGHNRDAITFYESADFTSSFDNGADARKMMNPTFNIYAETNDGKLAKIATDGIDGTQLSFQAGNAVEYTMTFSNRNNDNFVLVDNLTNARIAMTDGATYTFVATPNETTENRFEIRKASGVVTDLAEMKATHAVKGIYTAAGQYVGKADRWSTLPAGMYIVDGVRMAK